MIRCLNCMKEYPGQYGNSCPYCGYVDNPMQNGETCLSTGSILQGRYIVGTVDRVREVDVFYHAWDALFDRRVRIQEYFPRYCAARSGDARVGVYSSKKEKYQEGMKLFCANSRELIRLYRERDVVTCHACFRENGTAYAVMEDRDARTLQDYLEGISISAEEAEDILRAAMDAVEKCHRLGICHGIIDPACFWFAGSGQSPEEGLILKDFGAWRYISGAPGIVNYGQQDQESDVYGLAKLFYRMVSGREYDEEKSGGKSNFLRPYSVRKDAAAAITYALDHEIKTVSGLRMELSGISAHSRPAAPPASDIQIAAAPDMQAYMQAGSAVFSMSDAHHVLCAPSAPPASDSGPQPAPARTLRQGEREEIAPTVSRVRSRRRNAQKSLSLPKWVFVAAFVCVCAMAFLGSWIAMDRPRADWGNSRLEQSMVRVPNVIGKDVDEAEKLLEKGGLRMTRDKVAYSDEQAINQIYYQGIKENDKVRVGTEIPVWISLGEKSGTIPSIVGVMWEEAEKELREAGFENIAVEESQNDGRYGSVLALSEAAGASVSLKKEITVTVCKNEASLAEGEVSGNSSVVPDIVGMTREQAEEILAKEGFHPDLKEVYSDTVEKGAVISQDPGAGEEPGKGAFVEMLVSLGKEMVNIDLEQVLYSKQEDARDVLAAQGFQVGDVSKEYNSSVSKGLVIRVLDENGKEISNQTQLEKGAYVRLAVSLGPKPIESKPAAANEPGRGGEPAKETASPAAMETEAGTKAEPGLTPETGAGEETAPAAVEGSGEETSPAAAEETGAKPPSTIEDIGNSGEAQTKNITESAQPLETARAIGQESYAPVVTQGTKPGESSESLKVGPSISASGDAPQSNASLEGPPASAKQKQ